MVEIDENVIGTLKMAHDVEEQLRQFLLILNEGE
jgi:hypothetical protein